jgi:fructose-1,6-bisphosphatase/inositol monophosphatase family enzyme
MEDPLKHFLQIGAEISQMIMSSQDKLKMGEEIGKAADGSPTSLVDKRAEEIVLRAVEENDFDLNVVTEDKGIINRGKKRSLVVDPIDGTYNVVHGIPAYAISMAVVERDISSAEIGFVMNLASRDWYYAVRGKGLIMNGRKVTQPPKRSGAFLVHLSQGLDRRSLKLISRARKYRYLGCAALELALVATGSVDVAAHLGRAAPLRNIDVAAGVMMVREVGGRVIDGSGKEFNLGLDPREKKNMIAAYSSEILEGYI